MRPRLGQWHVRCCDTIAPVADLHANLFSTYERLPDAFDELIGPEGGPQPEFASVLDSLVRISPDDLARRAAGELVDAQPGRDLLGLLGPPRRREDLPVLPHPADDRGRRLGPPRARARAAGARARAVPRRRLRRAEDPGERARPRASWCWARAQYLPMLRGIRPPGGRAHPHRRHRPHPRPRRHLPRARGQPAHAPRACPTCCRTGSSASACSRRCSSARGSARVDQLPDPAGRGARARGALRPRRDSTAWCSRPGPTTRPTSSTASWPGPWASSWSRPPTSSSTTTRSSCARPAGPQRVHVDLPAHRRGLPRSRGVPARQPARRARA